jgi:hypothetical protein
VCLAVYLFTRNQHAKTNKHLMPPCTHRQKYTE